MDGKKVAPALPQKASWQKDPTVDQGGKDNSEPLTLGSLGSGRSILEPSVLEQLSKKSPYALSPAEVTPEGASNMPPATEVPFAREHSDSVTPSLLFRSEAKPSTVPRFDVSIPFVDVPESESLSPPPGDERRKLNLSGPQKLRRMASAVIERRPQGIFHVRVLDRVANAQWMSTNLTRADFKQLAADLQPVLQRGSAEIPIHEMFHKRLLSGKTSVEVQRANLEIFMGRILLLPFCQVPVELLPHDTGREGGESSGATTFDIRGSASLRRDHGLALRLAKLESDNWETKDTPGATLLAFLSRNVSCRVDRGEFRQQQREKYEAEVARLEALHRSTGSAETAWVTARISELVLQKVQITDGVDGGSSDLPSSSKTGDGRVLEELLATEKSYLQKLLWVCNAYKAPLDASASAEAVPILKPAEIAALFGNVEDVRECSKVVFSKFSALSAAGELGSGAAAEVISECVPVMLKAYRPYIRNFSEFPSAYAACKRNARFVQLEQELERDKRAERLTLADVMVMPVQRIPRISLLFHELLKNAKRRGAIDAEEGSEGTLGDSFLALSDATTGLDQLLVEINSSLSPPTPETLKTEHSPQTPVQLP